MSSLGKRSSPSPHDHNDAPPSSALKPAKRSKTDLLALLALDSVDLAICTHDELVAHVETLQQAYRGLAKDLADEKKKAPVAAGVTDAAENWSDEKVAEQAKKIKQAAFKAIKSAMKWQPSCKKGSTRWSYEGVVPSHAVFYKLFNFPVPTKKKDMWKQKKLTMEQMEDSIGCPDASIRYGSLSITGDTVTLTWHPDDNTFKLTGTYGL
ncbi:hypothetical protein JCM8097_006332 [Rhodosporidiobolus ruineniae]